MTHATDESGAAPPDDAGADSAAAAASYRQIFARHPRPMWVYDTETLAILAANDAAITQYGYTAEEYAGMTIHDLRSPAEQARLDRYLARRPAEQAEAGTWQHRTRSGALIDVEIVSHDIEWHGRPARAVTAYYATERLRRRLEVEAALASLSSRVAAGPDVDLTPVLGMLAGVLGAARAYLLVMDADARELRPAGLWPPAEAESSDAPRRAAAATPARDAAATPARDAADTPARDAAATPARAAAARRWPDARLLRQWVRGVYGDDVFIIDDASALDDPPGVRALLDAAGVGSVLAVPIRRGNRGLLGALGFDHADAGHEWSREDVRALRLAAGIVGKELDRRRATAALRASEERLRLILGQLPAVLWTTDARLRATALQGAYADAAAGGAADLDANGAGILGPLPPAAAGAPGADPGATLLALLGVTEEGDAVLDAHRRALAGEAVAIEWAAGARWMQAHIEPLESEAGATIGTVGIALDVTERRALEAQLRYSQRMEAVGRLAGGVAHDFNNILTSITGHAGFLLDALAPDDPRHADADEIRRAAERAAALTRQLLVFARRQVVLPSLLDLGAVLAEMRGMLRPLLGEAYTLRTDVAADVGTVLADRGQIEQVVMNLVLNARDSMPAGGAIDVDVRNTALDDDDVLRHPFVRPGEYVRLAVSDHGVGVDAESQAHVFEPFFTTKEAGKGTGLGLSTVYAIVKHASGFIWLHSEPGHGTTVEVLLPRRDSPVEAPATPAATPVSSPAATPSPAGGETIVLVEDEASVRAIVQRLLEGHGYRVLTAAGGQEALRLCEAHPGAIDLLVTDVVMPGMSGRELADRLETLRPGTPTLFMSGYTADEIIRRGIVTEEIAFIEKPFAPAQLLARIRDVLERQRHTGKGSA